MKHLIRNQHCQLEVLEMAYMKQDEVTDDICKEIAFCKRLMRLDLSGCTNMQDEGLIFMAKGTKKIKV